MKVAEVGYIRLRLGEGWGGGWCSEMAMAPPANNCATPTPNPSPQGGGEQTEPVAPLDYSPNTQIIVACEWGRISGERESLALALRHRPEAMAMYCLPSTE
jgi:hypothetical protein